MTLRYKPNMTKEEEEQLLREIEEMDKCYEAMDTERLLNEMEMKNLDDEEKELFDPVKDGWVSKTGKP